jgi:beta-fructofuranosidase
MKIITLAFALTLSLFLPQNPANADSPEQDIARATAAMEAAVPRAQADPTHPIFHITSPAQWMNDPNGPIFYKGYYHMFYQLHPFSDGDGPKYWGHVRSRNLATWERLPIALCPSTDLGEDGVWSGCCTINGRGEPMIFYTSVGPSKNPQTGAEQWAAIGDKDLITWRKLASNPVLSQSLHAGRKIYEWRDPFIFKEGRKTFLVAGGNLNKTQGGQSVVNIYEAQNAELTQWTYRGILFELPDAAAPTVECPNFFKLDNRWVLIVSPANRPEYFVGDFDAETCRFTSTTRGTLDCDGHFYAPNTMQLSDGRRILWGWVNGFPGGRGWNGCLSVPRVLSLSSDGDLRQTPAPQLEKLRGPRVKVREELGRSLKWFNWLLPPTNTMEFLAEIDTGDNSQATLTFESASNDTPPVTINFNDGKVKMMDTESPVTLSGKEKTLKVRVFVDHSVMEVFVNDQVCGTTLIPPWSGHEDLKITSDSDKAEAELTAWPMKSCWQ